MADDNKTSINCGGGLLSTGMFLIFLYLKLTGTIDWSWLWVTAPLWVPIAIVIGLFVIGIIIAIILDR